jgi:hypothetical protein
MESKSKLTETLNIGSNLPVIAASYIGPALLPNADAAWEERALPLNADDLVQKVMGQPLRRAGRFIKLVCCGALTCIRSVQPADLTGKRIGIFLATGLGNIDEILPFITQVFKHDGGFPSPNQFANSVSNAAAFFLARICDIKGVILTISQEELSFESALWLAQSYLTSGEIDLALVGGCDVFTPTVDDYRARMDLITGNHRAAPVGEGSSWLLLGNDGTSKIGDILSVEPNCKETSRLNSFSNSEIFNQCMRLADTFLPDDLEQKTSRIFLPGFRLAEIDAALWQKGGWTVDDYLPHCGIHSTATAFGLARAILTHPAALLVHYNHHGAGRQALVAAITK